MKTLAMTNHNINLPSPPSKTKPVTRHPETFHTTGQVSPMMNPANEENKDIQAATNQKI